MNNRITIRPATIHDRGFERVGLIVDVDNPAAERLYNTLSFSYVGNKRFLGHAMHHLQAVRTEAVDDER